MAFDPNRSGRRLSLRGLRRPLGVTPRIVLAFAYILLLASVGFGLGEFGHLRTESRRDELRTTRELTALGAAYAGSVLDGPPNARARGLRRVARDVLDRLHRSGPDPLARVIIVREPLSPPASRRRGLDPTPPRVFADARASEDAASPRTEADWGTRPEIAAALDGTTTQVERHSNDLGASVVLTAAPIRVAGRPVGALRVTRSDDAVARAASGTIERHVDGLLRVGGVVLALGVIVAWILARHLTGPIRRLEQTARHVAAGDYSGAATEEGSREHRSLAAAFNEMTHRLLSTLHRQQEFVANASHQLRSPLTALRLRLELVRRRAADPETQRDVELALRETDRLTRIVSALLTLSHPSERPLGPLALTPAAHDAVARWSPVATTRRMTLRVSSTNGVDDAAADPVLCRHDELDEVLDVLLGNALRYAPPATTVRVVVGDACLEVCDEGPGVRPEERELAFERFYRGSASHDTDGSGLGLAIARTHARSWGGDVTLDTLPGSPGVVARVTFSRPAAPADMALQKLDTTGSEA